MLNFTILQPFFLIISTNLELLKEATKFVLKYKKNIWEQ